MKKRWLMVLLTFLLGVLSFGLLSCSCNEEETPKHQHNYAETVYQPTCTLQGYTEYVCDCGYSYRSFYVPALGHTHEQTKTDFSCEEGTSITYACACGDSYMDAVGVLGHSYTEWFTFFIESLNTDIHVRYCFVCDAVQYKIGDNSAIYDYEDVISVVGDEVANRCVHRRIEFRAGYAPTCTTSGVEYAVYCNDCQTTIYTKDRGSLDHDWTVIGYSDTIACLAYFQCQRCGVEKSDYVHDLKETTVQVPTCTQSGLKELKCKKCEYSYTAILYATGHKFTSKTVVEEATCETDGCQEIVCTVCGYTGEYPIEKLGHNWRYVATLKEPDCDECGIALYACERCEQKRTECLAPEHTYGSYVVLVEPTCTTGGQGKSVCTECGYINLIALSPLDHAWVTTAKRYNCVENGYENFACSICGETKSVALDPKGHDYEVFEEQASTCTEEGYRKEKCENCGIERTDALPLVAHDWIKEDIQPNPPTCLTDGYWNVRCGNCTATAQQSAEALGHLYEVTFDENTHTAVCLRCDVTVYELHDLYVDCVQENDTDTFVFYHKCQGLDGQCEYEKELARSTLDIHAQPEYAIDDPTCLEDGLFVVKCSSCATEFSRLVLPALGHCYDYNGVCMRCGQRGSVGLSFTLNEDGQSYSVSIGECTDKVVGIPSTYDDKPVTKIAAEGFKKSNVTSVVIPNSVTSIGDMAFYDCSNLTSVTIGNSVTSIGNSVFDGCDNLTTITIPDSVTSIGNSAFFSCYNLTEVHYTGTIDQWAMINFYGSYSNPLHASLHYARYFYINGAEVTEVNLTTATYVSSYAFYDYDKLTSVTIGNSVTSIGAYAFEDCDNLTSVTIGNGVTWIDEYAFDYCYKLTSVTVEEDNANYQSIDGNLYSKDGKTLIQYAIGKTATSFVIPDSVTSIGNYAFDFCSNLTSIEIPDSVTSIGNYAFSDCDNLTSVTIGNGVTSIGEGAFLNCDNLTSVTIGNSVTSIGDWAFHRCDNLTSIELPDSVTSIGAYAFHDCSNLTSIELPDSVTHINNTAFYQCYSLQYNVYNNAKYLGNANNKYLYLVEINAPSDITTYTVHPDTKCIKGGVFSEYTKLESITLPFIGSSLVDAQYSKFSYIFGSTVIPTTLTTVVITGETSIGNEAFYGCSNLTSIEIPDGVTSIGINAFHGCDNLEYTIHDNAKYLGNSNNPYVCLIGVIDTSITSCDIPTTTKVISPYAFDFCSNLTSIEIPDSVTSIGDNAFYSCTNLTSVTIGNSVTSIGDSAFEGCKKLTNITIPDSVTSIGNSAFDYCYKLTSVTVEEDNANYQSIDGNLYSKDGKTLIQYAIGKTATSFVIPDSVTSIGAYAFEDCDNLTSVTIGNGVTWIDEYAFYHCYKLTSVTVEEDNANYQSIDGNLYSKDGKTLIQYAIGKTATSFVIPDGVTSIGGSAFSYCYKLTSIEIPDGVTSIGGSAFSYCYKLTSIEIPDSVTSIGDDAFYDCDNLTSVHYTGTIDQWAMIDFEDFWSNPLRYAGRLYINGEEVTEVNVTTATYIGSYAFYNCDNLTSVTIGNSVTSIGNYAFSDCDNLTSVTIGNSVTSIGHQAFRSCDNLTEVYYHGTESEWNQISIGSFNDELTDATRYYYSATQPTTSGNYWHYVDGVPTAW